MKKASISIAIILLLGFADIAFGTSPQPEEVRPVAKETVCTMQVAYSLESEKGVRREEASSSVAFDASVAKKDVLDKMTGRISEILSEANVSEFRLECKFPK